MLREAIDGYHELLDVELAGESQWRLDEQLRRRALFFGDRALCTVLRPRFLSAQQYRFLQRRAAVVLKAFETAYEAAIENERVLAQFKLVDWECALVRHDPGFRDPSPVSRLDAFFVGESGGLRFTEYNAETPAGGAYNDVLTEAFYGLPIVREFLKRWDLRPLPARHNVLHALLDAYQQWSGTRTLPRIAIVDWAEVPTRNEFVLFQDYFARQGIDCVIADPRDMEYTGGRIVADGAPVDLIYKRVLISELVQRQGIDSPVIRAVRDGAVCMVNPLRCKILHKKASLAVLSDERNASLFSADEREAIEAHIPWTRVVEERTTTAPDAPKNTVDLLPFIAAHRDQLVLKPNDEYGGKGIVLGWEVDQQGWEQAIRAALEEPYIVQQRVALPTEPYPSYVDGRVHVVDRMVDTAPYAAYGSYVDGCLSRLSTAALLNVTAGGGSQTPTFVVEKRG
ncbi:MAG TPA: hypothetical protein VJO33_05890 [Gemmatimonadaceae bacterium]|nr:hypothetical protein [Gemmatimonadaceae bacterium]